LTIDHSALKAMEAPPLCKLQTLELIHGGKFSPTPDNIYAISKTQKVLKFLVAKMKKVLNLVSTQVQTMPNRDG
jgi:hypothetical protein